MTSDACRVSSEAEEKEYKRKLEEVFEKASKNASKKYPNNEDLLDNLGEILSSSELEVVKLVVPRSIRKKANERFAKKLLEMIEKDPEVAEALRDVGVSIANTLRPIAGNRFTDLVKRNIEDPLQRHGIGCTTKGEMKSKLKERFNEATKSMQSAEEEESSEFKPDIDIACYDIERQTPFLIISCKTTLAERLLQTVSWDNLIKAARETLKVRVFLATAWEDFEEPTQRARAHALDGAYAANTNVREDDKVKRLSRIIDDIIKARDEIVGKPSQSRLF